MAISKKIRFEVFKRGGFTCQYCGRKPPQTILEIDHIIPRKKKGEDNPENLITACFDCNRGKGARDLKIAPASLSKKTEMLKEKELQLREFYAYQEKIKSRLEDDIDYLDERWHVLSEEEEGYCFNDHGRMQIRSLLRHFNKYEIEEAMEIAWSMGYVKKGGKFKYMCGILWTKKRQREEGE